MNTRGIIEERTAERFLVSRGLVIVERNFRCRWGEIDLIARDRDELVFVEVRSRTHFDHGSALESIDLPKQRRWSRAAGFYLGRYRILPPCRFDVIGLQGTDRELDWYRNVELGVAKIGYR